MNILVPERELLSLEVLLLFNNRIILYFFDINILNFTRVLQKVTNIANYFLQNIMNPKVNKKRVIISFNKLTTEQIVQFSEAYPEGYASHIQKITKPSGEIIYVVPFETTDTIFMVKIDVKVDQKLTEEEYDKEIFSQTKTPDFPEETPEVEEEEEKPSKDTFVLIHGDYSDKIEDDDEDEDEEEDEED
mgnify:FL=1